MHDDITQLIEKLQLQPHPEGGWYTRTYRSGQTVTFHDEQRIAQSNIYFLLSGETFSAWHRLDSDETWHFYRGTELAIFVIDREGHLEERRLGPDGPWQTTIPGALLFAAAPVHRGGYAFVGCSVAPGFEFSRFEIPSYEELLECYPQHAQIIQRFTRDHNPASGRTPA